ncbi:MAG TPA: response regulator, partial [Terriglobales bacterium]
MSAQPVVYFIDDSATMREVIKIAFRRENIDVVTCHDATSALDLIERGRPDVVISDVIMPGRDGYDVCQYIKQHPRLNGTPVILMSGVVNKAVAEKAFAVRADELIRKPFQPQDLITRVRHLITPRAHVQVQEPAPQMAAATVAATAPQAP